MFSVYKRGSGGGRGGLYGKLGMEGVRRYEVNMGGAEVGDKGLVSRLLRGDVRELMGDQDAKKRARAAATYRKGKKVRKDAKKSRDNRA
ncbi:hypothetical protein TrRE_jg2851, partial [Triparma retinervis]